VDGNADPSPSSKVPARRAAAGALFAALVCFGADPSLLRVFTTDRASLRQRFTELPDAPWGGTPAFLAGVRARTEAGSVIAVAMPGRVWDDRYAHAYYRAHYALAGREVVPLVDQSGRMQPANLARARYVVLWDTPPPPGARVAWRDGQGALVERP
jgi:hypothetical protein